MAVLLYDLDCGFCTRAAGWVPRLGCDTEVVGWQVWPGLAATGITPETAAERIHLVDGARIEQGHRAIAATLGSSTHAPVRLLGRVLAARVLDPLSSRAYDLLARNRHRLPGGTPTCRLR